MLPACFSHFEVGYTIHFMECICRIRYVMLKKNLFLYKRKVQDCRESYKPAVCLD